MGRSVVTEGGNGPAGGEDLEADGRAVNFGICDAKLDGVGICDGVADVVDLGGEVKGSIGGTGSTIGAVVEIRARNGSRNVGGSEA